MSNDLAFQQVEHACAAMRSGDPCRIIRFSAHRSERDPRSARIRCEMRAVDARDGETSIWISRDAWIDLPEIETSSLLNRLRAMAEGLVVHELYEWLRFGGRSVVNSHGETLVTSDAELA